MFWFVFFSASALSAICSCVMVNRYFSFKLHKNTFPLTLATLTVNMFLLLSITYLLPMDVFQTALLGYEDGGSNPNTTVTTLNDASVTTSKRAIVTPLYKRNPEQAQLPNLALFWALVYWIEFFVCWFVLPVLISYIDLKYVFPEEQGISRRHRVWRRIRTAIFNNIKFYALCGVVFLIGFIYLVVGMKRGVKDIKPLIISLSHLYSLSYTLILLAMGLILLPKVLLMEKNDEKKLFVELSKSNDELNDSKLNLTDYAEKILSVPDIGNGDVVLKQAVTECKLEVQSLVNELKFSVPRLNNTANSNGITLNKINNYYNGFKTEYYNYLYNQTRSDSIIHTLALSQNKSLSMGRALLRKVLGFLCLLLSLLVAVLEVTPVKFAHSWIFWGNSWWNFLLEISILVYNTMVSLYAMSCFKFQNFHLIPNGQSSPKNTLYFSLYSSRLLLPLCFNFMTLIPHEHGSQSTFERVLYKDLTLIPLVNFLNNYLPVFFIIIVPLSYQFDLKEKVLLRVLGEEYYYELFGMMSDPLIQDDQDQTPTHRTRIGEDYEYSLQDGRYLFERATSNYNMRENSENAHVYV